jgi:hypothetical protein
MKKLIPAALLVAAILHDELITLMILAVIVAVAAGCMVKESGGRS